MMKPRLSSILTSIKIRVLKQILILILTRMNIPRILAIILSLTIEVSATQRGQKTVGFTRMFQLYQGYANSDRAQGNSGSPRLTYDLARNTATPVNNPGGRGSLSGTTTTERG